MIEDIKKEAKARMRKTIESLGQDLAKIRTGRAHPSLLDHVLVDYYGSEMPISQVASINVEDARTLTVTPWEQRMVAVVDKAIRNSDLGLNPAVSGMVVRIPLPPLTEARRRDMIKIARQEAEAGRVAIRGIRREAIQDLKVKEKEKTISEDDERRGEEAIQKLTDEHIKEIDKVLEEKEKDLMAI